MDKKCAICGKTQSLFTLELEEDGEHYTKYVCGSCWDVIAGVSRLAMRQMQEQIDRLLQAVPSAAQPERN